MGDQTDPPAAGRTGADGARRFAVVPHRDLLDNVERPSAARIVPELQQPETCQWMPMSPGAPSQANAFRVAGFDVDNLLLWRKPDSTWVWRLTDLGDGSTRLVTRVHAMYDCGHPLAASVGVVLMELGDFAMTRRMLRGIKQRAEASDRTSGRNTTAVSLVAPG